MKKVFERYRVSVVFAVCIIAFFVLAVPDTTVNVDEDVLSDEDTVEVSEDSVQERVSEPKRTVSTGPYDVVFVVDGDTVRLDIDGEVESVRLIGIDAPEVDSAADTAECFGEEASKRAKELLVGKTVMLEIDSSQDTRDVYDRLLGYIILPDGSNLSEVLIEEGYAREYTHIYPYAYQSAFIVAERTAEANEVGLWSATACDK